MERQVVGEHLEWDGRDWELRAALRNARRAQEESRRSGRQSQAHSVLAAAVELSVSGGGDFTIKQVAERARVAMQTVYRQFGTKDELLLAVIEENILSGCAAVAKAAEREPDPESRLRSVVRVPLLSMETSEAQQSIHFYGRERLRLAAEYPGQTAATFAPYVGLLTQHLSEWLDPEGRSRPQIESDAEVIQQLVTGYANALGTGLTQRSAAEVADLVWSFCRAAITRPTE